MTGTVEKQRRYPTDIVIDTKGCWRTLYSDGSFGPVFRSIDELCCGAITTTVREDH
jgi:hypothetical protein